VGGVIGAGLGGVGAGRRRRRIWRDGEGVRGVKAFVELDGRGQVGRASGLEVFEEGGEAVGRCGTL
jgi:hypothetical protein